MKLFVLLPRVPFPLTKGDKLRAFNHIKFLSRHHEIHLCTLNDEKLHPEAVSTLKQYCASITIINLPKFYILVNIIKTLFTQKPFQVGYFFNYKVKLRILRLIKDTKPDHIYCQLIRTAEYVKRIRVPKTLDYQDVFSKGIERRISTSSFLLRPLLVLEYERLLRYERHIFKYFDVKTIISYPDRSLIPHPKNHTIHVIPNGVDTDYFSPLERNKEYDLLFTGNMNYPPNVYSAEYLINKILPCLRDFKPDITLMIAGTNPSKRILALQSESVRVTGWVEDMRECYAGARIFIAPMQIGTGLQNKLLEAMAMQLPCITSNLANSALKVNENEDILVGRTVIDYVKHIVFLLDNPDKAKAIAMNGYKAAKENYNWLAQTDHLSRLMKTAPHKKRKKGLLD